MTGSFRLSGAGPGCTAESWQNLSYTINAADPSAFTSLIITSNGQSDPRVDYVPTPDRAGSTQLTVQVQNHQPTNNTRSVSFTFTLAPVNDPPQFTVSSAVRSVQVNSSVDIPVSALLPGPAGAADELVQQTATLSVDHLDAKLVGGTVVPLAPDASGGRANLHLSAGSVAGPARVTLKVVDSLGLVVRHDVHVDVRPSPVVNLGAPLAPVRGCAALPYTLTGTGSLPMDLVVQDGSVASVPPRLTQGPSALSADGVTQVFTPGQTSHTFTWNVSRDVPWLYANSLDVKLHASRGSVQSAPDSAVLSVLPTVDLDAVGGGPLGGDVLPLLADFNDNGRPDLVVLRSSSPQVSSYSDPTEGGPVSWSNVRTSNDSINPLDAVVADVNVGGRPDIVVLNSNATVTILQNASTSAGNPVQFNADPAITLSGPGLGLAAADFNADGFPDLVVGQPNLGRLRCFVNVTTLPAIRASWASPQDVAPAQPALALTVADVNQDGLPDLVSVGVQGGEGMVSVLVNRTTPGSDTLVWQEVTFPLDPSAPGIPVAVAALDLDGDGRPDLVAADATSLRLRVLRNTTEPASTPSFAAAPWVATLDPAPDALVVGDFNRDGRPDLLARSNLAEGLQLFLNVGKPGGEPTLVPESVRTALPGAVSVPAVADVDLDGDLDVWVSNLNSQGTLLFNPGQPARCAPTWWAGVADTGAAAALEGIFSGELNGDGKPDALEVTAAQLRALAGQGDGRWVELGNQAAGTADTVVAVADVDGDFLDDVLAVGANGELVVRINASTRTAWALQGRQTFPAGLDPTTPLLVVDLDLDGVPEVVGTRVDRSRVTLHNTSSSSGVAFDPALVEPQSGSNPVTVAAADLNGDGLPDLVRVDAPRSEVHVTLNQGELANGTYVTAETVMSTPAEVALARVLDVDQDGRADLLLAGSSEVWVSLNRTPAPGGALAWQAHTVVTTAPGLLRAAVGDVDGDGVADVAVLSDTELLVLLNRTPPQGATAFTRTPAAFPAGAGELLLADLDGDGRAELVVAQAQAGQLTVLPPLDSTLRGPPGMLPPVTLPSAAGMVPLAQADLDGDGRPEVVVAEPALSGLRVLHSAVTAGSLVGTLEDVGQMSGLGTVVAVAAGDLDGDGTPDLVAAVSGSSWLSLLHNATVPGQSSVALQATASRQVNQQPVLRVELADLNGDGRLDLLAGDVEGVWYALNATPRGGGTLAFQTTQRVGNLPGPLFAVGDLQGDGMLDLVTLAVGSVHFEVVTNTTRPFATSLNLTVRTNSNVPCAAPLAVVLADLNGDAQADLAVSCANNAGGQYALAHCDSTANCFGGPKGLDLPAGATGLRGVDLDGQGLPDLVAALPNGLFRRLTNLTPAGGTTLVTRADDLWLGANPGGWVLLDLNQDGLPDLVAGRAGGPALDLALSY